MSGLLNAFPFNGQQNSMNIIIFWLYISEDSDNLSVTSFCIGYEWTEVQLTERSPQGGVAS